MSRNRTVPGGFIPTLPIQYELTPFNRAISVFRSESEKNQDEIPISTPVFWRVLMSCRQLLCVFGGQNVMGPESILLIVNGSEIHGPLLLPPQLL